MDSKFKPNDAALFIDRKGRSYLKILRPGVKLLIRGELMADAVIGVEEGSRVKFSSNEMYLVLRPTYADLIPNQSGLGAGKGLRIDADGNFGAGSDIKATVGGYIK